MPVFFASAQNAESGGVAPRSIVAQGVLTTGLPSSAMPGAFVEFMALDAMFGMNRSLTGETTGKAVPCFETVVKIHDVKVVFVMPDEDVKFSVSVLDPT